MLNFTHRSDTQPLRRASARRSLVTQLHPCRITTGPRFKVASRTPLSSVQGMPHPVASSVDGPRLKSADGCDAIIWTTPRLAVGIQDPPRKRIPARLAWAGCSPGGPIPGPRGKQEISMRKAICKAVYWLIEPLLDRLDQRQHLKDERLRRAAEPKRS